MFCTKCGTRIADGSGVCTNCGVSVASTPIQPDSQVEQNTQMNPFAVEPDKKKSKKPLIITLIIVAIIAIAATVLLILKPWADKDDKDVDKDKANTEVASTEKVIDDTWDETDAYHGEEMSIEKASDFVSDFLRKLTNEEYDNAVKRLHPAIVDKYIGVVNNDNTELIKFLFAEIFYNDIVLDCSSSVVQGSSGSGWKAFAESLDNVDSYTQPIGYADAVISFDTYMSEGDGILEIALCDDGRYYITSIDMSGVVVTSEDLTSDDGNMIINGEDLSDLFTDDDYEFDGSYGFGQTVYEEGYSYEVPYDWECIDENNRTYVSSNSIASMVQQEDTTFGQYGVHEYFESLLNQYSIQGIDVLSFGKYYIGGNLAVVTEYQKEHDDGEIMNGIQVMYLYEEKLVAFTIATSDVNSDDWAEAMDMVTSFRIN